MNAALWLILMRGGEPVVAESTARAARYFPVHGTDNRFHEVAGTDGRFREVQGADGRFEEVR